MTNKNERTCQVCGKKYIHNSRVRCKNCRVKRVKIAPSWDDGKKTIATGLNKRDRLFMRLGLFQALREGEIFGSDDPRHGDLKPLTRRQIDLENKKIVIYGKGGTVEYVFMDPLTVDLLKEYFEHRKIGIDKPIFNLKCRHAQRIVKAAAIKAGVENAERFGPHILRSISITHMEKMKGLKAAQHHARHSSERTTLIYVRPTVSERRENFNDVFTD